MRNIHCVRAAFGGIRTGAYREKGLSRVRADGKALFAHLADFADAAFIEAIPEGTEVFMGVQAFPDGTFWMHWLHAPGYGTARPPRQRELAVSGLKFLLVGLAVLLTGGYLFLGPYHPFLSVIGCLAALGSLIPVFLGGQALLVACNRKARRLRRDLEAVLAGKTDGCARLHTLTDFDPEDGGLAAMLEDAEKAGEDAGESCGKALYQAEGPVSQVSAVSRTRGAGRYRQYFIEYLFACEGRFVSLTIGEDTPALLHPVFRRNHPFMLAEGDRVRLIVADDARTVKAMRNLEDGCAYWVVGEASRTKIKKAAGWMLLIPVIMILLAAFVSFTEDGYIHWDFIGMMALVSVGCIALAFALLSIASAYSRNFGDYRADLPLIIEALELSPARNTAKPYIHEL